MFERFAQIVQTCDLQFSSGASQRAPHGVATLEERKGPFDTLKKGSGALGQVEWSYRRLWDTP